MTTPPNDPRAPRPPPSRQQLVAIGLTGMGILLAITIVAVVAGKAAFDGPAPGPAPVNPAR